MRESVPRASSLDPWREQIEGWLREDRQLTAKRVRRLLLPLAGAVSARTVRRYVAALRRAEAPKEAFVRRSVLAGSTMEVDFGESWADIGGAPCKVKYLVATLPYSNAYFAKAYRAKAYRAKAYRVERLESLLDGIESAFRYFCQAARESDQFSTPAVALAVLSCFVEVLKQKRMMAVVAVRNRVCAVLQTPVGAAVCVHRSGGVHSRRGAGGTRLVRVA